MSSTRACPLIVSFKVYACICIRLGLDSDVIEAARKRLDTGATAADTAITKLEQLRSLAECEETAVWAQSQAVRWDGGTRAEFTL